MSEIQNLVIVEKIFFSFTRYRIFFLIYTIVYTTKYPIKDVYVIKCFIVQFMYT